MHNQPTILKDSQHNPSLPATFIIYLTFEFQLLSVNFRENHIIMGDFNIPTNVKTSQSDALKELVNVSNLTLHNTYPTHEAGNTLDLIISQYDTNIIESYSKRPLFSDYYTIFITINSPKPPRIYIKKSVRKCDITYQYKFTHDLKLLPLNYANKLKLALSNTLHFHDPLITKHSILRNKTPGTPKTYTSET